MPRYDLLACRTLVQWFHAPDKGILLIPEGCKDSGFRLMDQKFHRETTHTPMRPPPWLVCIADQICYSFSG